MTKTQKTYTLITGASSGIGEATAYALAKDGRNLILIARRKDKLDDIKARIEDEYKVAVETFQVDLSGIQHIEDFFKKIQSYSIDILINNAGLALGKESFEDYKWDDFNQMIDVNIKAFTRIAQLTIPYLKKTKGHIVNISSIAGVEAYEGGSVYGGTKAFVDMISRSLRIDLMGTGVRVTDVAPGATDTEFSKVRFKGDSATADLVYKGYTPLYAKDIADTIVFALSRPPSVDLQYIQIMSTAQASATRVARTIE